MKTFLLFAILSATSHSLAAIVLTTGGWHEKWQHCYANEIKNVLEHSVLKHDLKIEDYESKGSGFSTDLPQLDGTALVGAYYVVDLIHKTTGHAVRTMFKGYHDSHLSTFDPVKRASTYGYYCTVNTNLFEGYTALVVFDRDEKVVNNLKIKRKVYLYVGGSGIVSNSDSVEVPRHEGD